MFIYLDTETTGSGSEDRLCQIAFKTDAGTTVDAQQQGIFNFMKD